MTARRSRAERGSAVVEFVTLAVLLLIPTIYLVATLAQIQAATFAVEAGAREAGRQFATASSEDVARARAQVVVALAADDHHLERPAVLRTECEVDPCLSTGARIVVRVDTSVPLPLVPDAVAALVGTSVDVHAEHQVRVDRFAELTP